jgi:hypothetical protein
MKIFETGSKTNGYALDPMVKSVVTVLEGQNLKASPSVCHNQKLMLWVKKAELVLPQEKDAKTLTPIAQGQPLM